MGPSPAAMNPTPGPESAEPEASQDNAGPTVTETEHSLSSSESDGDDRRDEKCKPPVVDSESNVESLSHVLPRAPPEDIIREARKNMTDEQRAHIDRRMEKVHFTDQQEELPQYKGKSVDPRNWGNIHLDEAETDPQVQQEMITEFNLSRDLQDNHTDRCVPEDIDTGYVPEDPDETREHSDLENRECEPEAISREELREYLRDRRALTKLLDRHRKKQSSSRSKRKERAGSLPLSDELENLIRKVAEGSAKKGKYKATAPTNRDKTDPLAHTKPITQVTPGSALGRALDRLSKHHPYPRDETSSSSSDDDSGSRTSEPSSDDDGDSSDSSSSSSSGSERRSGTKRRHHSRRRSSYKRKRTLIKPTPPEKYGGQVDLRAFHKFLTHGTAYVKYGYVERPRQVMVLSEFLTGKAYTFYTQRVSLNPERWGLQKFFTELFNYCFPIDFRNQQRTKLHNFVQGHRSVHDYVADLDELFTIVGADSKRAKVVKLFNGFRAPLRKALLREHMNPEHTSWKTMVRKAEYQEMAENVDMRDAPLHGNHPNKVSGLSNQERNGQRGRNKPFSHHKPVNQNLGHKTSTHPGSNSTSSRRDSAYQSSQSYKTNVPANKKQSLTGRTLSKEEREALRSAGKCFICKQEGHFSRNCPDKSRQTSSGNRPPGLGANSIRFGHSVDFERTEQLRVDSLGETTTSLSIGMVKVGGRCDPIDYSLWNSFGDKEYDSDGDTIPDLQSVSDSDSEHDYGSDSEGEVTQHLLDTEDDLEGKHQEEETLFSPPMEFESVYPLSVDDAEEKVLLIESEEGPRRCIGHAVARKAEDLLESLQPYPGDPVNVLEFRGRRFLAYLVDGEEIMIHDKVWDTFVSIERRRVKNVNFPIGEWYADLRHLQTGAPVTRRGSYQTCLIVNPDCWNACQVLMSGIPYPPDNPNKVQRYHRFEVIQDDECYNLYDRHLGFRTQIEACHLKNPKFDLVSWYRKELEAGTDCSDTSSMPDCHRCSFDDVVNLRYLFEADRTSDRVEEPTRGDKPHAATLELFGQQVPMGNYPSIQRNSASTKDPSRKIPKPLVIVVKIDGEPARALVDSGSLGDFISSLLVQQLRIKKRELNSPIPVQLAVQGSRSRINFGATAKFEYQSISETRYFDVINLSGYDLILGTPWLFQHRISFGINPSRVVVGSATSLPLAGGGVTQLASRSMELYQESLEQVRGELRKYALPICKSASETPLPPLRAINHEINLIDPHRIYPWRPSRCPEAMRTQWIEKRDAYIKSGRWQVTSSGNTVPMMLIPKPSKPGEPPRLRTVFDLRSRNANTIKRSSPLPDIDGILRRASRGKYRSILDGKDAYEQIRIIPEHVERTAVTTPDGNMVSNVVQQGDCNAPATYQALMNHIFSAYIGRFLDVYLDDIIIYSDTLEDHIKHVKLVIDILQREKLYLGQDKLQFLCPELKVLGRIVDDDGIQMDPDKVDALIKWKTPTNRDLLRGFLGAAGYLADDIDRVRIPMGILHQLTGDTVPF